MSETIALKKKLQKKVTVRAAKIKHELKTGKIKIWEKKIKRRMKGTGIVLLKHVPHGFYENELRRYFSQFGEVLNVVLCRSMKTGQSKGFAFIHFADEDVAKIAAETMDNYLMFKKRMIAKFLTPSEAPSMIFKRKPITPKNVPLKRIRDKMNRRKNAIVTKSKYEEKCKEKLHKLQKVTKKLAKLGIDYSINVENAPNLEKKEKKVPKSGKNVASESPHKEIEKTIVNIVKDDKNPRRAKSLNVIKPNEVEKTVEIFANKRITKRLSLGAIPKAAKSPNIENKQKRERTPKSKKNEKNLLSQPSPKKLKTPNKLELIETNKKAKKTPESKKNLKNLSLINSPRKSDKTELIETKQKIKKNFTSKKNADKKSLKTISKAKTKITKTKTQKKDVKKLKSALEDYMAENFGKSKPRLRSQTVQKK